MFAIMSFTTRKRQSRESGSVSGERLDAWMEHPLEVGSQFGVDPKLWSRNWAELSGGEGQRIMMAIGIALGTAEVLLLDGEFSRFPFPLPFPNESIGPDGLFFFFFDVVWNLFADHADIPPINFYCLLTSANLEPTSALDPETMLAVETYTLSMLRKPENTVKAIVWVTHSEEQAQRVGTRLVTLAGGRAREDRLAPVNLV